MIAAYMYMGAKNQEERAYYDWMGFVGNLIAVGATLLQPFTGLLLAYELCDYDFSFCPYMMADQLSMFFEMQGAIIGLMFLAINYYVWLSLKRIGGSEKVRMTILAPIVMVAFPFVLIAVMMRYWITDPMLLAFLLPLALAPFTLGRFIPKTVSARTVIKIGFLMAVVADAIWLTPHGFAPTGAKMVAELELPPDWDFLGSMPAKLSAMLTLVFVTVVNYVIYNRAIKQGTILWGKIDFASQFVLIFMAFTSIWTMGLMGAVRSLLRKYFHTYSLLPDFTAESFTPTLSYSAWWITGITVTFFAVVSFAVFVTLRPTGSKVSVPDLKVPVPDLKMSVSEGSPAPARAGNRGAEGLLARESLHGKCD
jgi:hypothetical protein